MNDWLPQFALLAETERARAFSETFRGATSQPEITGFFWIATGICVLLLVSWIVYRLLPKENRPRTIDSPRGLFKALCRAHELDGASRRLLWRLAQQHHPQHPAVLFTTPESLEARLATSKSPREAAKYRRLREQLFGIGAPIGEV
jgi:hypothetical protein